MRSAFTTGFAIAMFVTAGLAVSPSLHAATLVAAENRSIATTCAEVDNVDVRLAGGDVRRFTITARHPDYLRDIPEDDGGADFSGCPNFGASDPVFQFAPLEEVLYDGTRYKVVAHRLATFWRNRIAAFEVAGREMRPVHLVQLYDKTVPGRVQILVVYPADGYWRIKPQPPDWRGDTVFGSSFLIGPIVDDGRPVVDIERIVFDPETGRFTLSFPDGDSATLSLSRIAPDQLSIDVAFDPPVREGGAFAGLRSMFVTEDNSDTALATWRAPGAGAEESRPILAYEGGPLTAIWFERHRPSRHNPSAPDIRFSDFSSLE